MKRDAISEEDAGNQGHISGFWVGGGLRSGGRRQ